MPKLSALCLDWCERNLDELTDLRLVREEGLVLELLRRVIASGKLTFRLCLVFKQSGHDAIEEALAGVDLIDGLPGPMTPKVAQNRMW